MLRLTKESNRKKRGIFTNLAASTPIPTAAATLIAPHKLSRCPKASRCTLNGKPSRAKI